MVTASKLPMIAIVRTQRAGVAAAIASSTAGLPGFETEGSKERWEARRRVRHTFSGLWTVPEIIISFR